MRSLFKAATALACVAAALAAAPAQAAVSYTYAGSWIVGDGPSFVTNPPVYSGQSAAAFLFGGDTSDYVISTISDAVTDINRMAYYDGYGTGDLSALADTFSTSGINGGTYSASGSYSAYVQDDSCFNRYSDPAQQCIGYGTQFVNYAFRADAVTTVPEPMSAALLGAGIVSLGAMRRRR